MVLRTSSQCVSLGAGLSALTLAEPGRLVCFSQLMLGHRTLGLRYLPPAGSFRFEAPGAEQVGIVTGLLEGGLWPQVPVSFWASIYSSAQWG